MASSSLPLRMSQRGLSGSDNTKARMGMQKKIWNASWRESARGPVREKGWSYWKSPGHRIWVSKVQPKVDPVCNHDAACDKSTFDHDKLTSTMRSGALALPGGDCRCIESITEASHNATDDELRELV